MSDKVIHYCRHCGDTLDNDNPCDCPAASIDAVLTGQAGEIAVLTEKLRAVEAERDEAQAEVHRLANGEGCNQCNDHIISLDEDIAALRAELERKDAALKDVELAFEEARDCVLNERHELAEQGTTNDSINSVLAILDRTVGAALQPKEPPCQKA